MKNSPFKFYRPLAAFLVFVFVASAAAAKFSEPVRPLPAADAKALRAAFARAVDKDFEIVRDEMKTRPRDTVSEYWLVHVKPKRSGHYTLKYTYKFVKSLNNYPEEGENTFLIGVGGKKCYRRNLLENGISNFCLGDTIIIPIRTINLSNQEFTLESRYQQESETFEAVQKEYNARQNFSPVAPQFNQLAKNVKLLGTRRAEMPHRSCCAVTVDYYAVFEALKPGRFNLVFSSFKDTEVPAASLDLRAFNGIPVVITSAGTPITALIPSEKTITYADEKRFSAHAGNSFITNLLILQPGDRFALRYASITIEYGFGKNKSREREIPDLKPAVYKRPFALDKNWSFNEWLAGYLPEEK